MREERRPSYAATIYIGGDLDQAKQVCREFCRDVGACVTVTPTTFVYTGGEEAGVAVGFINYGRFPAVVDEALYEKAVVLGDKLRERLCQTSYSIVDSYRSVWRSWREE